MGYILFIMVSVSCLIYLLIVHDTRQLIDLKQRRKIMPSLAIRKSKLGIILDNIDWKQPIAELLADSNLPEYYIECINLGRGPALHVTCSWRFNIDDFIRFTIIRFEKF